MRDLRAKLPFESVVQIFTVSCEPSYLVPWQVSQQTASTGSGFFFKMPDGRPYILTNAHVASSKYDTVLRVQKHGSAEKFPAQTVVIGFDCDLALLTVEDYIARSGPTLERDGFFEQEIARTGEVFGDFAHVWTTYEGRRALTDEEPFLRGINSIQLVRTDGSWRVLQILWEQEAQAGPVPDRYLPR